MKTQCDSTLTIEKSLSEMESVIEGLYQCARNLKDLSQGQKNIIVRLEGPGISGEVGEEVTQSDIGLVGQLREVRDELDSIMDGMGKNQVKLGELV